MSPRDFVLKWKYTSLSERAGAQSFFNDLCSMLEEPTPAQADPEGVWYAFEKGARKTTGGAGWADVWKRGHFAWEMKGRHQDLTAAFAQLQRYSIALESPPLLVVSDFDTIVIHTNFTNTVHQVHTLTLGDLEQEKQRRLLKWVFSDPEQLRPGKTREQLTEAAAAGFAELAQLLRDRGHEPQRVAHFLHKILFCMFAEDIGVLQYGLFTRLLEGTSQNPQFFVPAAMGLLSAMRDGGWFGVDVIEWFNGGLFDDADVLPLDARDLRRLLQLSRLDWSSIEPSIFGTLFERGLDPSKRSQLGAHYTDVRSIQRIIQPVIVDQLLQEWQQAKAEIQRLLDLAANAKSKTVGNRVYSEAEEKLREFRHRLVTYRVLDPACGSGNFLYLALIALKDIENRVLFEAEEMGFQPWFLQVDPAAVQGIEINPYAVELARVTVWIGQIQWMLQHGHPLDRNPVLKKLDQIACGDAVISETGGDVEWPKADAIIGNPPFLGNKKMISLLGDDYVAGLRHLFEERLPGGVDYVTYWFEKARQEIQQGRAVRAGLVATQAIRQGSNRTALTRIRETGRIFNAYSDEEWVVDGAAVRVSIVCFDGGGFTSDCFLDERPVGEILSNLTADTADITAAARLPENLGIAFQGPVKVGPFDIPGELARK